MVEASRRMLVQHAVTEAVSAHAAPQVSASVVRLALRWARESQIPVGGSALASFVEGPLHLAVEEILGAEAARAVRDELRPIVERVEEVTQVRRSRPPPEDFPALEVAVEDVLHRRRETAPAPNELPLVLVATQDSSKLSGLASALAGEAFVEAARDALMLLDAMASAHILVLDCEWPTVRPETLIAVEPELPRDTCVVLWADEHALEMQLSRAGTSVPNGWVVSGLPTNAEEVAALCRVLRR